MRVLHVLNDVGICGNGTINAAVDLACAQSTAGHVVAVASAGGGYEELLHECGVRHYRLDPQFLVEPKKRLVSLARSAVAFHPIARDFRPAIVHAHTQAALVVAFAARASFRYRLVVTAHNVRRVRLLSLLADRVIAVSAASREAMASRGAAPRKLRVVRNGTLGSPRIADVRSLAPVGLQRPAITTVAGMYRRKGIGTLIEAFSRTAARFPDAHLYVVGEGPDRADFERAARASPAAGRIHFTGFLRDPRPHLLSSDIFVLASLVDPCPLVLGEARAAGCAIIASAVDGIPESLDDGAAGILVAPGDAAELARSLSSLLGDPARLAAWRAQAHRNLDWLRVERMSAETCAVYAGAIAPRPIG